MEFTKQEYREQLIPNGRMIEEYIKEEIMPNITENITIDFGDIVQRGRYNEIKEHEFSIHVHKDNVSGSCGGLTILFDIKDWQKGVCGYIDVWNNYGYGGEFLFNLCLHWSRIKREMLNSIDRQKSKRQAVLKDFTV